MNMSNSKKVVRIFFFIIYYLKKHLYILPEFIKGKL
jgi:hypothetical protein